MIPVWLLTYMCKARKVKNDFNGIKVILKKDNKVMYEKIFQAMSGDSIVLNIDSLFPEKENG